MIILLIETWIHRLHGQFGIVLIAAAVGTLSPLLFTGQVIPSVEWTTIFRWHLLLAIAAYAFLMIAFVHAVLMALINRRLKSRRSARRRSSSTPCPLWSSWSASSFESWSWASSSSRSR